MCLQNGRIPLLQASITARLATYTNTFARTRRTALRRGTEDGRTPRECGAGRFRFSGWDGPARNTTLESRHTRTSVMEKMSWSSILALSITATSFRIRKTWWWDRSPFSPQTVTLPSQLRTLMQANVWETAHSRITTALTKKWAVWVSNKLDIKYLALTKEVEYKISL